MKTKEIFKEMNEVIPDIEKMAEDKNTIDNLSVWMSGYFERAKLEKRLKKKKKTG